jgi:hypothetical protein
MGTIQKRLDSDIGFDKRESARARARERESERAREREREIRATLLPCGAYILDGMLDLALFNIPSPSRQLDRKCAQQVL